MNRTGMAEKIRRMVNFSKTLLSFQRVSCQGALQSPESVKVTERGPRWGWELLLQQIAVPPVSGLANGVDHNVIVTPNVADQVAEQDVGDLSTTACR